MAMPFASKGDRVQTKYPGPGDRQLFRAESAAAPQSKVAGSTPGGQSTNVIRFSFRAFMKPNDIAFLINARSGSKNPRTLRRTTAAAGRDIIGSQFRD